MKRCIIGLFYSFFIHSLSADILILNDETVIRGKITGQNNQEVFLDVYEIRTKAQIFSKPGFVFRDQKKEWKSEVIGEDLLYFSGNPLLSKAKINLRLIKEKAVLPRAEIELKSGEKLEEDFYQKTNSYIYYYNLKLPDTIFGDEEKSLKNLKVKEDVSGEEDFIPEAHRPALQKKPLREVKSIYIVNPENKNKIYPEKKKWLSDGLVGISYHLLIPTGQISAIPLSPLGFMANFSYHFALGNIFPLVYQNNLRTRVGLALGWQRLVYETEYSISQIHLFPILGQFSLYYDIPRYFGPVKLAPFLRLNPGLVVSQLTKTLKSEFTNLLAEETSLKKQTYFGFAFLSNLGLEFLFRKYPRWIYNIEVGYFWHLEKLIGTFVSVQASVGYLF